MHVLVRHCALQKPGVALPASKTQQLLTLVRVHEDTCANKIVARRFVANEAQALAWSSSSEHFHIKFHTRKSTVYHGGYPANVVPEPIAFAYFAQLRRSPLGGCVPRTPGAGVYLCRRLHCHLGHALCLPSGRDSPR